MPISSACTGAGEMREHVDDRGHDRRIEHLGFVLVVHRCLSLAKEARAVVLRHVRTFSVQRVFAAVQTAT